MFPKISDWKSWNAIEKATYVAQLLAPFSLLVTVLFSYFGWMESRKSQQLQIAFFQAQNSPELTIDDPHFVQNPTLPLLVIPVSNTGYSTALNVCLFLYIDGSQSPFNYTCEEERPFKGISVTQSQSIVFPIATAINLEAAIGFRPKAAHKIIAGLDNKGCNSATYSSLVLRVQYYDVLGKEYNQIHNLLLCLD